MEEIFKGFLPSSTAINYYEMFFKMFLSTILGTIIAFHVSTLHRTLHSCERLKLAKAQIILCLVGAIMVIVIGDNVARAFGLFGLGSFIRFRTAIKDALDTAIIFLLIGIGMAIGVGFYIPAIMVFVFLYVILIIMSMLKTQQEKAEDVEIKNIRSEYRQRNSSTELEDAKPVELVKNDNAEEISSEQEETKTSKKKVCPQCAEKVKIKAIVCRYCGYEFYDEDDN